MLVYHKIVRELLEILKIYFGQITTSTHYMDGLNEFKELNKNLILEDKELHILVKTHKGSKLNAYIRIEIHSNDCEKEKSIER